MQFIEELAQIHNATGYFFHLPERWTARDEYETHRAFALLAGVQIKIGAGTVTFSMKDNAALKEFWEPRQATNRSRRRELCRQHMETRLILDRILYTPEKFKFK